MEKSKQCTVQDYYDVITHPMDLSLIEEKVTTDQYKDPWEFIDDMELILANAVKYNGKKSKPANMANKVRFLLLK